MNRWISALADAARSALSTVSRERAGTTRRTAPGPRPAPAPSPPAAPRGAGYPGDFTGVVRPQYAPSLDGNPDPGEIVWTWVPYEEDFTQGKDRPVLLVGRDGAWLLGLMLTSKDRSRNGAGGGGDTRPQWLDIGSGPWDAQGRDSEVRLDRVLRVDPAAVRREGAIMGEALFQKVTRAMG